MLASALAPEGENYKFIDLPLTNYASSSFDTMMSGGKVVGASMFSGYSFNERKMLSLGFVEEQYAKPGTQLTLVWGEENGGTKKTTVERHKQTELRVEIGPTPYASQARETYHQGWRTRELRSSSARIQGPARQYPRRPFYMRIAGGRDQPAEREIMRVGVAELTLRGAQRFDDAVGSDIADQRAGRARHQPAQRRIDPATLGVADERRHAGRTGEPDLDRIGDAAGAQLLEPGDDALGGKRELADDVHAQALRGGAGDLLIKRSLKACGRDARMALGVGADADLFDAGVAQAAFLDHRQRVGEGPGRLDVAADHQQAPGIGFAAQTGEQVLELGFACEPARGDMDDRLEADLAQGRRCRDGLVGRCGRHRGDVDLRAGGQDVAELHDLARARPRALDRERPRETGGAGGCHSDRAAHSRLREITKLSS